MKRRNGAMSLRRVAEAVVMGVIGAGAGSAFAAGVLEVGPEWLLPVSAMVSGAGIFMVLPLVSGAPSERKGGGYARRG